jgi:hypothetical protein
MLSAYYLYAPKVTEWARRAWCIPLVYYVLSDESSAKLVPANWREDSAPEVHGACASNSEGAIIRLEAPK